MYLIIDECCGKGLLRVAEEHGHTAQRSVDVASLGAGASDGDIFAFAQASGAVLVTVNQGDFIDLAGRTPSPCGLILLPAVRAAELAKLFRCAFGLAHRLEAGAMVRVDLDGRAQEIAP